MKQQLLERVELLIQQNRYKEARKILTELLAMNPNDSYVLSMFSNVLLQLDEFDKANEMIESAIALDPDEDFYYYIKAVILLNQEKMDEAEVLLKKSISLNPYESIYFAYLASVKLARKQYNKALDLANKALAIDPENVDALNTRSTALLKLDKKQEAFATIEGALQEDPNNPRTHANYGWSLLESGDNKKALIHFKEALKNDPNLAYAQSGMVEALKAKYFLYRLFLKYSFWMQKMTSGNQWTVIIGFYVGMKLLRYVAEKAPTLRVFLYPILAIFVLMALSTWIMTPISNLFLRMNIYGRNLLDKKEIKSSNFVGLSAFVFVVALLLYLFTKNENWIPVAVFGFAMMIPFSAMFAPTKYKNAVFSYIGLLVLLGCISIIYTFSTGILINLFSFAFIIGLVAFQWISNFLFIREGNL